MFCKTIIHLLIQMCSLYLRHKNPWKPWKSQYTTVFQSRTSTCIHKTLETVTRYRKHLVSEICLREGEREPVKTKVQIPYEGGQIPHGKVCEQRNTHHFRTLLHGNLMEALQYSWMPLKNSRHARWNPDSQCEFCLWFQKGQGFFHSWTCFDSFIAKTVLYWGKTKVNGESKLD